MRLVRWMGLALAALFGTLRRRRREAQSEGDGPPERIVEPGSDAPRAELVVAGLLLCATGCAAAFVVLYALDGLHNRTRWLGLALGTALAFIAAALLVVAEHLVVSEELEDSYHVPAGTPDEQQAVVQILRESTSRFTRKRLMAGMAGMAGGALGLALLAPVLSLGPVLDTESLFGTPWRRGRRLVDEEGRPLRADDIEPETFYTAYPEHESRERLGAPLVLVRLPEGELKLPPERARWAPGGILAYSKICTHAGCAIALYRKPTFAPTQPRPALVCPCHYSTFDPATGGSVIFGPAGRDLPQLPLVVDAHGHLRAGGNFSGPVGPSFAGVRRGAARTS